MAKKKSSKKGKQGKKFVVTGKFTMKSSPVSMTKAKELMKKIEKNGGTATKRKV